MCTLVNQKGEKETKKNGAYLESQSTCVFSDQEIGQSSQSMQVKNWTADTRLFWNLFWKDLLWSQTHCPPSTVLQEVRKVENYSYWCHVQQKVHRVQLFSGKILGSSQILNLAY